MIGSFKERLKRVKEGRSKKPLTRSDDLIQKKPSEASVKNDDEENIGVSTSAESTIISPSLATIASSSYTEQSVFGIPESSSLNSKPKSPVASEKESSEPNYLPTDYTDGFSAETRDSLEDDAPSVPPPPVPDLPPPDVPDLTPPSDEESLSTTHEETESSVIEEKLSNPLMGHQSSIVTKQQREAWKRKSDILEGTMSNNLPLLIESNKTGPGENRPLQHTVEENNFKNSAESISSLPDFPPPTLPDSPPPNLPDSPPPIMPDDTSEIADIMTVVEFPQVRKREEPKVRSPRRNFGRDRKRLSTNSPSSSPSNSARVDVDPPGPTVVSTPPSSVQAISALTDPALPTHPDPTSPPHSSAAGLVSEPSASELSLSTHSESPSLEQAPPIFPTPAPPTISEPAIPEQAPPSIPTQAPPTILKTAPPTFPTSAPPIIPYPVPTPSDRISPEREDSSSKKSPPFHSDLPPLPDVPPPTFSYDLPPPPAEPDSLPPPPPSDHHPPEPPSSPLPNISSASESEKSPAPMTVAELTAMSTPPDHPSAHASNADALYILADTPPIVTSAKFNSSRSPSPAIGDDMKSTSTPNIDPETNSYHTQQHGGTEVQMRTSKHSRPTEYRQSFPIAADTRVAGHRQSFPATNIRVISDGSPPSSPDLKFTRVAKKTWKNARNLANDLSASASTGNVMSDGRGNKPTGATTGSLRSLQSDESSFLFDNKSNSLQKPSTLSPLAAMSTSTPAQVSNGAKLNGFPKKISPIILAKLRDGQHPRLSPANVRGAVTTPEEGSSSSENLQQLRVKKRTQLDIVRGVTERPRQSPMSSFILDSNLLDVSMLG